MKPTNFDPEHPFRVAVGTSSGTSTSGRGVTVREIDLSPTITGVTTLVVPNGGLTSLGSNSVRLEYGSRWLNLANRSGGIRSAGDVVIIDTANDESFTTSVSSNTTVPLGIVDETIAIGSNGRVVVEGYAPNVRTLGTAVRGDYLFQSTTAATAAHMAGTNPAPGAFGYVLKGGSGTNASAHIFPTTEVGAGSVSYASNSNQVGTANAAGASLLVSRGDHVHRGVSSLSSSSNTFYGDVILAAGSGVGITSPTAGTFTFSATGGGGSGTFVGCSIYHSTTSGTSPLPFDSELFDTDAFHDTSSNNSRVTVPTGKGGKYSVTFHAITSGGQARLQKNGSASPRYLSNNTQGTDGPSFTAVVDLVAGDYLEVVVTGGTWGHASAYEAQIKLWVVFLGA